MIFFSSWRAALAKKESAQGRSVLLERFPEEARLAAQEEEAVASDAAKAVGVVTSALPAEGFALALLRPHRARKKRSCRNAAGGEAVRG